MKFYRCLFLSTLFLVPLIFLPVLVEQFEMPKLYILWIATAAMTWLISFRGLKHDQIGIGLLAFLGSTVLSSIVSMSPRISLLGNPVSPNGVMSTLAYVCLYFVAKRILDRSEFKTPFRVLVASGGVAGIYAVFQYLGIDFIDWTGELSKYAVVRPASTMGHPNFLAAYTVMILPAVTFIHRVWLKRLAFILFMFVLLITQSRGAWVAFGVMSLLFLRLNGLKTKILAWLIALCAVLPIVSQYFANNVVNRDSWPLLFSATSRFASVYDFGGARMEYLRSAWRVFCAHPLFGSGTDTFQLAFEHRRTAAYWVMEPGGAPHRAHNEFLNIAATQGVFGVVALLTLLVCIKSALDDVPRGTNKNTLVLILAGFLITSLVGFPVAATSTLFIVTLACVTHLKVNNGL